MSDGVASLSIEEMIGWKWTYRGLYQESMWMTTTGMLTTKHHADMDDMLEWIKDAFPGSNLAITTTFDGKWNMVLEYADGSWKHATGEHILRVVENMVRQLAQEVDE